MKRLKPIALNGPDFVDDKNYILMVVPYERFGNSEERHYFGTGAECKEKIKEVKCFENWKEDIEADGETYPADWGHFIEYVVDFNGDGDDYIELYSI